MIQYTLRAAVLTIGLSGSALGQVITSFATNDCAKWTRIARAIYPKLPRPSYPSTINSISEVDLGTIKIFHILVPSVPEGQGIYTLGSDRIEVHNIGIPLPIKVDGIPQQIPLGQSGFRIVTWRNPPSPNPVLVAIHVCEGLKPSPTAPTIPRVIEFKPPAIPRANWEAAARKEEELAAENERRMNMLPPNSSLRNELRQWVDHHRCRAREIRAEGTSTCFKPLNDAPERWTKAVADAGRVRAAEEAEELEARQKDAKAAEFDAAASEFRLGSTFAERQAANGYAMIANYYRCEARRIRTGMPATCSAPSFRTPLSQVRAEARQQADLIASDERKAAEALADANRYRAMPSSATNMKTARYYTELSEFHKCRAAKIRSTGRTDGCRVPLEPF